MRNHRTVGAVLAGAALLFSAACSQDLSITNPNAPDVARALASPSDVQNLAVSSVNAWYLAAATYDPWVMLNTTGDLMTMNYGNFGARFNNLEPRIAYNNSTASGDEEVSNNPWNNQYGTLGEANDVLRAIASGVVLPGGTDKYKALAMFSQVGALMELSLLYDQAFAVDETTKGVVPFSKYTDMEAFTKKKIDALIAFTANQSFSYTSDEFPVSIMPPGSNYGTGYQLGSGFTSTVLNRLANTWGAMLLAYSPRTAAEANSADWASVLAYAKKGIGQGGGAAFDFSVIGDGGNKWWDELSGYFDLPSWMMVDLHLISQMAPNVPSEYTGQPASPASAYDGVWAPQSPMDARLSIDLNDVNSYISGTDDKTDYVYARQVQGSAARGIYMQSPYYHVRYINNSWQAPNSFIGPQPFNLAAESDLLEAEALVRTHGDKNLAATLVNTTRVGRGQLTPLTAATSDAAFLQAITYEIEVECNATDGYGFFALRGMDQLQAGTLRHLPVPATELGTDRLPVYTFGGVGLPDMDYAPALTLSPGATAYEQDKYESGPFRNLNLPNGQTMLLPSPRNFTLHRPAGLGGW